MITSRPAESSSPVPPGPRFRHGAEAPATALEGPALVPAGGDPDAAAAIPVGWTRVGSSPSAGIRLDHPSVSRRHAVIVHDRRGSLQVIDDRSLTGVFVNGRRVSWAELGDGDELSLGDVRMIVAASPARRPTVTEA